jgi:hypothetical protein
MSNYFDFNDADGQRERGTPMPAGTLCKVVLNIRAGGEQSSGGWLTQSKSSDALYLDCELTVLNGEYAKRKLWTNLTVSGGKLNDKGQSIGGNISRATIRAMLESARNISPVDMSNTANAKRQISGFGDLDGLEFAIKVGMEKGKDPYPDKNTISLVVTPEREEYAAIMAAPVAGNPAPVAGNTAANRTAAAFKPSWAGGAAAPAPAPQTPAAKTNTTPAWAQ